MRRIQASTILIFALSLSANVWSVRLGPPISNDEAFRLGLISGEEARDKFRLWTGCGPIGLRVYVQNGNVVGLTKETIEITARDRLRNARIYEDPIGTADGILRISVLLMKEGDSTFAHMVWLEKLQFDKSSDLTSWSSTDWREWAFGTHAGNADFILSGISQNIDEFITDYLRVNEPACGNTPTPMGKAQSAQHD